MVFRFGVNNWGLSLIFSIVDLRIGRTEFPKLIISLDSVFVANLTNSDAASFLSDFVVTANCQLPEGDTNFFVLLDTG
ncbi:Uncharacterised protein [Streptococcus pneumoniae]|nr:Uncharacterised protein [Streptococcus pneumoniae]